MLRRTRPLLAAFLLAAGGCSTHQETESPLVVGSETGMLHVARGSALEIQELVVLIERIMKDTVHDLDDADPKSEVSRVNRVGDSVRLPVSRPVHRALELARYYHQLTDGAFDITTGPIAALWEQGLPSAEALAERLERSGMENLEISDNGVIAFTQPGIQLAPGRFAFAYALDMAVVERRKMDPTPCLIAWRDLARRDGPLPPDQSPLVPIIAPGIPNQPTVGSVDLSRWSSLAIVHNAPLPPQRPVIIDPRNGFPASSNRLAVVIGPLATKAYALAQAMYILGPKEGAKVLSAFPEYEAMVMPERKRVTLWMTRGFAEVFTPDPFYRGKTEKWEPKTTDSP